LDLQSLYYISPELSLVALALVLIALDLITNLKKQITWIVLIGLILPLVFIALLWIDVHDNELPSRIFFDSVSLDHFALTFKALIISILFPIVLLSHQYSTNYSIFRMEYFSLILISAVGMMLLASANDLITIYIALELTAIPIAALATFMREIRSVEAGMKFLILSAISSAILLYGLVLLYGYTGSVNLEIINSRILEIGQQNAVPFGSYALLLAIAMIVAGFGFKIATVPFQMWAPDVYEGSPLPVTAFLSVASKAAGFAVILRVFNIAFANQEFPQMSTDWSLIWGVLAVLSMTIGNIVAIRQTKIIRLMAYSSVAHAGYILIGVTAVSSRLIDDIGLGVSAATFYLIAYAATNIAAFSVIVSVSKLASNGLIQEFSGLKNRSLTLSIVMALAVLSLIGLPPSVGFVAKFYLFGSAISSGLEWLAIVGVLNSVVSAYYYLRILKYIFLSEPDDDEKIDIFSMKPVLISALISMGIIFVLGVFPGPILEIAEIAADALLLV
tara:strand:+ start:2439 stop:3947 length:1509 start_codon:yes stop_codon:yes gene_type:complete